MKKQKFIKLMMAAAAVSGMTVCTVPAMAATIQGEPSNDYVLFAGEMTESTSSVPEVVVSEEVSAIQTESIPTVQSETEVSQESEVPQVIIQDSAVEISEDSIKQLKEELGQVVKTCIEEDVTVEETYNMMSEKLNQFSVQYGISFEQTVNLLIENEESESEEAEESAVEETEEATVEEKSSPVVVEVEEQEDTEEDMGEVAMTFLSAMFVTENDEVADTFESSPISDESEESISDITTFESAITESESGVPSPTFDTSTTTTTTTTTTETTGTPVAQVGDKTYVSIQEAVDNANGGTVKLLESIDITEPIVVTGFVTIDLNGKTITNTKTIWNQDSNNWSLISVRGGELVISGGTVQAKANDCYAIDVMDGGTLTINGGTYIGNVTSIYVFQGELIINDGNFSIQQTYESGHEYDLVINCNDEAFTTGQAKATIYGGVFSGFDPAHSGEGVSLLATGYGTIKNADGTYTVAYGVTSEEEDIEETIIAETDDSTTVTTVETDDGTVTTTIIADDTDDSISLVSETDTDDGVLVTDSEIVLDEDGDIIAEEDETELITTGVEDADSAKTADISLLAYAIPAFAASGVAGTLFRRRKIK